MLFSLSLLYLRAKAVFQNSQLYYINYFPVFTETQDLAESGMVPAGLYRNRDYRKPMAMVAIEPDTNEMRADILFDPQNSGELLISVSSEKVFGCWKDYTIPV
jgi:selenophosphate synthase